MARRLVFSDNSQAVNRGFAIAVFARAPVAGRAKTRLIPLLGARGAAELQGALLEDTLNKLHGFRGRPYLFLAGSAVPDQTIPRQFVSRQQQGRGLGERLDHAFHYLLKKHSGAVVIGTDSPLLGRQQLRLALNELKTTEAVLGPCPDGGFYLIGLRRLSPGLFDGVRWGSRFAFADMRRRLLQAGFSCSVLEGCADVDRPEDFRELAKTLERHPALRRRSPAVWRFCQTWLRGCRPAR